MNKTQTFTIYLALGTNMGNRLNNLLAATQALPPEVRVLRSSPIYQTPPWGYSDQADFLNQVLLAETNLNPQDLLAFLKLLETQLGRKGTFKNGPRLIDLDILFYEDLILETPGLTIPHPRIEERAFVLVPLADLAPNHRHPGSGQTMSQLLENVDIQGIELYRK